jgi:hypothetical protein
VGRAEFLKIEHSDFDVARLSVGVFLYVGILYLALRSATPQTTWLSYMAGALCVGYCVVYWRLFYSSPRRLELVGGDTLVVTYFGGREERLEIRALRREKREHLLERTFEYVALRDSEGRCRVRVWTMMKGWKEFVAAVFRDDQSRAA